MRYRGEWRDARGEVRTDRDAVESHLRWLLSPLSTVSRRLMHRQLPSDHWFGAAADGYVLVEVSLE